MQEVELQLPDNMNKAWEVIANKYQQAEEILQVADKKLSQAEEKIEEEREIWKRTKKYWNIGWAAVASFLILILLTSAINLLVLRNYIQVNG